MDRRKFIKSCSAVLGGGMFLGSGAGCAFGEKGGGKNVTGKPNIIFVMIDDLGWFDVGFNGSTFYETPNIDKLAGEGMIFTNAYANAANCAPTRACLLTGQYTPRHGVYTVHPSTRGKSKDRRIIPTENTKELASKFVTIAEALKPAGYTSASMGKWHMGDDPELGPIGQGFDVNIGGGHWGHPPKGYFAPFGTPNLEDAPKGEYLTDRLTDEAVKFIDANKNGPFFLYLPHYAVHTPIQAKAELTKKYEAKQPSNGQSNAKYAAMIESTDDGIGRIMDKLSKLGIDDNTIVFFFSDNGGLHPVTSHGPLRGSKGAFYEGGIREPMAVRWPGRIKAGTKCDVPVIGIDFYPTMVELAAAKRPAGVTLDGETILGLLKGEKSLKRDAVYWHFPAYLQGKTPGGRDEKFRTRPVSVIRKGKWKLMQFIEEWVLDGGWKRIDTNNSIELYDLDNDIGEKKNLANVNKAKRDELLKQLQDWQKKVNAPVPTEANTEYVK